MRMGTLPAFRLLLRHGNPRGLPRDMIERMYRDFQNPAVQRAVLRLYRATDPADSAHLHQRLRSLDRPALVVWVPATLTCPCATRNANGKPSRTPRSSSSTTAATGR